MPLTCPYDAELLLVALGSAEGESGECVMAHVETCPTCRPTVAALRELIAGIESTAPRRASADGGHLDELQLAELVDGVGDDESRGKYIAHLASCGECRIRFASLVTLVADPAVAAAARHAGRATGRSVWRRRIASATGLVAAAAVFLMLAFPHARPDGAGEHRGPTITAAPAPVPITPLGDVESAKALRWASVAGAERYRVTLFDASGTVVFEAQGPDTSIALPDSVALVGGRSYLWKVEARTGWERWVSSELSEFRVRQSSPPDSLRQIAHRVSDSVLAAATRARPLEVRDALSGTLALAATGPAASRDAELVVARRIAAAYAAAWHDQFLVREVARFTAWPPERRAERTRADSIRREGVTAYGRDGAATAVVIWRTAESRAAAIGDTALAAATLGNIGAALARDEQADSATVYLERARLLAVTVGDIRVEANAISELAGVSEQRNDIDAARQQYARAISLRDRIGDSRGLAADYNNLAGLAQTAGDLDEARRQLNAALAINRRDGRAASVATNLVNLAGLASLTGDFANADTLYREALATWRTLGQWPDVADALRGVGDLALRRGDYPGARSAFLEAVTLYDRTGPVADALAVRQLLASARAAAGDLQGALSELRRAQTLADSAHDAPDPRARITLGRADLAAQLNSRADAERFYASAEQLFREANDRAGAAEAQQGRAELLLQEDDTARAQELLDAALRAQMATGNQRAAALVRESLANVALHRGDTAAARQQLARASADLDRLGDPIAAASVLGQRAALEAAARMPAAAQSLYRTALAKVGDRLAPDVTWRLHAGLGAVDRDRGSVDDAAREMRSAITDIEQTGRSLTLAERRSAFLTDKWDVYVQLALLERARGRVAAAFDVSERVRASEMLELLAEGRVAAPRDTAAELVAREQDLRHRIAELTRGVEGAASGDPLVRGPDVSRTGAVTREALLRAQESYGEVLLEMRERAPQHASLVSRTTSPWRDVARRLAPNEAMIEYLLSDGNSLAFVVTRDSVTSIPLGVSHHELARLVDFVRGTLQPRGSPRLDSLWRAPLRQLHRALITPVEMSGLLAGKTRLIIVPHAELHYLPFAALMDGARGNTFLVERYQITVTPSASVWLALGTRPARGAATGMLAFAPRPDALPASRDEVATITKLGGANVRALVGSTATEAAFKREAPGRRVIHLATYGVLNKQNPLFSFVELAPGGAEDGRLEAHEVFGLRLNADLVVLSACQTGLASGALTDVPAGDDWIGLARAFLSAGAGSVMASLWPVQDRATAALMERFYQRYTAEPDAGFALASAQRALIAAPATASPYYWAGFELVGGR